MLPILLFTLFVFSIIIQIVYFFWLFNIDLKSDSENLVVQNLPISIVIAAKNEANNLSQLLDAIIDQNHRKYEVILVNDASTDDSLNIMLAYHKQHKNFKVINLAPSKTYTGNKKNALTHGIAAAQYEQLLFIDADCLPVSNNWAAQMASHFSDKVAVVLGYGAYSKIRGSLINKIIRYETLLTAIQYFSYAKQGMPYMGVGRNLAYKKTVYKMNKGFKAHRHIKSGDDDLLIRDIALSDNTAICLLKESFTVSKPETNLLKWIKQKRRHISTAHAYKPKHKILLGLFYLSQFLFWLLAILLLVISFKWQLIIILIAIRQLSQFIIYRRFAKTLDEKDLIYLFVLLDFLVVIFQMTIFMSNLISKPRSW